GKLVNTAGEPYETIIMSHCRNHASGKKFPDQTQDAPEYNYMLTNDADVLTPEQERLIKGAKSKGAQPLYCYSEKITWKKGNYHKSTHFLGVLLRMPARPTHVSAKNKDAAQNQGETVTQTVNIETRH